MPAKQPAPAERGTVTLRRVSPCEHGINHSVLSVLDGTTHFAVPECRDSKGNPRNHRITTDKYPTTERKR